MMLPSPHSYSMGARQEPQLVSRRGEPHVGARSAAQGNISEGQLSFRFLAQRGGRKEARKESKHMHA